MRLRLIYIRERASEGRSPLARAAGFILMQESRSEVALHLLLVTPFLEVQKVSYLFARYLSTVWKLGRTRH